MNSQPYDALIAPTEEVAGLDCGCQLANLDDGTTFTFCAAHAQLGQTAWPKRHGLRIIVLDAGYVFVGHVTETEHHYTIGAGYNVRRYGTDAGLGQLALEGKRPETVLDAVPMLVFPKGRVIFLMECVEEKWQEQFPH